MIHLREKKLEFPVLARLCKHRRARTGEAETKR
ncbi:hypothetical protein AM469_006058, partial [Pseudomonas aeruginosa]